MSAIRKYYLIRIDKRGLAHAMGSDFVSASTRHWQNYEKPLIKKDNPRARVIINESKKDNTLVDSVLVLYPGDKKLDGIKDYIISATKYKEMIKKNKFKFE